MQAQFLIPMAVTLAAGVLFATVTTLVFVPSLYLILVDIHDLLSRPQTEQNQDLTPEATGDWKVIVRSP